MSGVGVGGALLMLLVAGAGTAVLIAGGLYVASGLVYIAYKGITGVGKAISRAYASSEAERRAKAAREFEAVSGELASIMAKRQKELTAMEEAADAKFNAAAETMEAGWRAVGADMTSAEVRMDEALVAMQDFFTARASALNTSFVQETREFERMTSEACSRLSEQVISQVEEDTKQMMAALDSAERTIEERDAEYMAYARRMYNEAKGLLAVLREQYDCGRFAAAELKMVEAALQSTETALASGLGREAAGHAASASQQAQILHIYAEQRTSQFNREKMLVEQAMATLRETVELSRNLEGDGSDKANLADWLAEGDASFWSEGRLDALWKQVAELQSKAEGFTYGGPTAALAIVHRAEELRLSLIREYSRTRMHVLSKESVLDLAGKLIAAHEEAGWTVEEDGAFLRDDCRNDLRIVFTKNGDERVVIIRNRFDPAVGAYTQQIVRFAEEAGEPDEESRRAEDELINEALSAQGVPEEMHVKCDMNTYGQQHLADS